MLTKEALSTIPQGGSVKVPHKGCSASAAMQVSNWLDGYLLYCHKCGYSKFIPHHDSQAERRDRKKALAENRKELDRTGYGLPKDFSHSISATGLAWLGRAGWTLEMIKAYGVGWSQSMRRVIVPFSEGYTARSTEAWLKPKYLEKAPPWSMWISDINRASIQLYTTLVITEDVLSAGRVGEFLPAMALNGTSMSTAQLGTCIDRKNIILWLDPDAAGRSGVRKLINRLGLHTDVSVIQEPEPKHMCNAELKETLCSGING